MGDGPFTDKMQARIDKAGLADRVRFLGFVRDRAEVLRRFSAALSEMIGAAAKDGAPFDDESVFRHRSEVIRQYLGPETG